ncbi:hypothetical protein Vlu01_36480 [Micromonospora lutea]|uniref:Uncharacterized protein n=1 Tax=Micromonospora lutea TaxID=419825 RepID=A0ABQ4IYP1_9ACTN|nr:hypothetical protein Vlu01_36480 [Micromonospora lutea]
MEDQLVVAVVGALAAKGAEALASGARTATAALARLIRSRLRSGTPEGDALTAAMAHPSERDHQVAVASFLAEEMSRDPAFDAAVRAAWLRLLVPVPKSANANVVNNFSGTAERVVQAGDVRGDITF